VKTTRSVVAVLIFFALFAGLQPLSAQQVSGLTGIVTDSTGAAVAGANVKLTNTLTGATYTTQTDEGGKYLFPKLPPSSGYTVTFTKDNFRTLTISQITLGVGVTETHNGQLEVGSVSQTVEVSAEGEATLNTTDATIGNVLDTRRLHDLPIQIRTSPARLLGLQPGVVAISGGGANRDGAVTGARTDQGNITVDGIDVNDMAGGFAFTTVGQAPIDSIQEFRTVSADPTADAGRSSGAQIQLVTKSGTNNWHGSAREFNRSDKFAANSFFNNKAGTPKPELHRNQFGGSFGGHIIKDKLFFFSDYEGRRDASQFSNARTVPLAHVFDGQVAYIHQGTDASGAACTRLSNLSNQPTCITIAPASEVTTLDPQGVGANAALETFLKGRYPVGQLGLGLGNSVNTGGVRFNSPVALADNIWTNRVDFNANKHKLFGRFNVERFHQDRTDGPIQEFPGDDKTTNSQSRDWGFVIGHTWTMNTSMINQATFGITKQVFLFNRTFRPSFPNSFTFGAGLSAPFTSLSSQGRSVPVPTLRDDFTYIHGKHTWVTGFTFKPIQQQSQLTNDFNFLTVGLGGNTGALNSSLRPSDILNSATARSQWDGMFTFELGRIAAASTQANYSRQGTPFPAGTGKRRNFKYNEYEIYVEDSWKARPDFTLTYGLRWQYYGVPYEANGFQAINDTDFSNLFNIRQLNGLNGVSGPNAEPFLRYDLGGKANGARGFYEPDLNNFAPRFSFAYNPSVRNGFLGKILGDRKTVIRAGGGVVYDRVAGAITFIQDQVSYLFDNNQSVNFGGGSANSALLNDPRFTGITDVAPGIIPTLPTITRPFTPFVSGGIPTGNATGEFNFAVDQNFRTPYSYSYALSVQRELRAGFIAEVAYVGRMGRKLFAQADASQIIDFKDASSGQFLIPAFNALQQQINAGGGVTPQLWIENQLGAAILANFGLSCTSTAFVGPGQVPFANCTELVGRASFVDSTGATAPSGFFRDLVQIGDTSDTVQGMFGSGFLFENVGMSGQFSTNIYNGSYTSSSYNGMLLSLRKRYSHNLQFDLNYTYAHSIDNQSSVVNTVTGGLVCDLRNLRVCRGNSDFDVTHIVNFNGVYDLPIGRGQLLARNAPGWLDRIIGGWEVSGIQTWRSGFAFGTTTGTFPVGFNFDSPAVLTGSTSAIQGNVHTASGSIQFFKDPAAALAALSNPTHGVIGNRNNLRGPHFWNVDLAVLKSFKMPWSEAHRLQLRAEMYNGLNHPSFNIPTAANSSINSGGFGTISSTASTAREVQFGLRYDF